MKSKIFNYNNLIILIFSIVVLVTILFHEIWNDEVQSFIIARDFGFVDIFKYMAYEGHSCLYSWFLRIFIKLGMTFRHMNYISLIFGVMYAFFFMYKAPFKKLTKTLLLFSPAVLYYSSVFARPYIFSLFFALLICILYKDRHKHPFIFGVLLALFFNTHILTGPVIGAIVLIEIYDYIKEKNLLKERLIICSLALLGGLFFFVQVYPSLFNRGDIVHTKPIYSYFAAALGSTIFMFSGLFSFNRVLVLIGFVLTLLLISKLKDNKKVLFILLFGGACYFIFTMFIFTLNEMKSVYLFILFLFAFWIYYDEQKKINKSVKTLLLIIMLLCTFNTGILVVNDILHDYSYSEAIAKELMKDKKEHIKVLTVDHIIDVQLFLDDRYTFTSYYTGNDYKYTEYNNFENAKDISFTDFTLKNDFDYYLGFKGDKRSQLLTKELRKKKVLEEVYTSDIYAGYVMGNITLYKINKGNYYK